MKNCDKKVYTAPETEVLEMEAVLPLCDSIHGVKVTQSEATSIEVLSGERVTDSEGWADLSGLW